MIKVGVLKDDGRRLFIVGLSDRNVELLREGKAILLKLAEFGGEDAELMIMWGENEAAITIELARVGIHRPV